MWCDQSFTFGCDVYIKINMMKTNKHICAQANVLMMIGGTTAPHCSLRERERETHGWCLFVEPVNFLISLHQTPTTIKGRMCVTQMSLSMWWYQAGLQRENRGGRSEDDDIDDNKDGRGCDGNDDDTILCLCGHDITLWCGLCLCEMPYGVCQLLHAHIHTGRLETRLLILIGASQMHLWWPQQEMKEGKRLEKRGEDEAPNERRLISECLNWQAGQREEKEWGMKGWRNEDDGRKKWRRSKQTQDERGTVSR